MGSNPNTRSRRPCERSEARQKTLLLVFSFFAAFACAEDTLAERFQALPSSARGPDAVLRIDALDADTALQRLDRLSDMGFGGVLLTLTAADDAAWEKLAKLTNRAAELQMEVGIQDFLLSANETARADGLIDVFDEKAVARHTNKMLSELQSRFGKHYGTTLAWFLPRSFPTNSLTLPQDMDTLFFKHTGFRLPTPRDTQDVDEVDGDGLAAFAKQKIGEILSGTWRGRFAETMRDLVQEAGLDAGLLADESLIPAEEIARYFKRPVLLGCPTSVTVRAANQRVAQGAHRAARRSIMGHLPLERVRPLDVPVQFASKREMDVLFTDGATRLLLDPGATAWQDETLFTDASTACLYARRWQFILWQSAPHDASAVAWQTKETGVEMTVIGRATNSEHIYCIVNESANSGSVVGSFPEKINGTPPERWSPENGEIIPLAAAVQNEDGQTSLTLFIEPYGVFFVVFKKAGG